MECAAIDILKTAVKGEWEVRDRVTPDVEFLPVGADFHTVGKVSGWCRGADLLLSYAGRHNKRDFYPHSEGGIYEPEQYQTT